MIGMLHGTISYFNFIEKNRLFHPLCTRLRTIRMNIISKFHIVIKDEEERNDNSYLP